ncbi:AAA family ATPase [Halothece sp. PCC 7418]|uniref:AAA family ATPase n=1 Tax=Halothece sp. (strain PCC 7418) TaxID=65093 RepID=UPI001F1A2E49|nr:AAA family ATPase [Halothece sp. PCC 7418]
MIGCPSSGKSTLARQIQQENPQYQIISTDQIRAKLFGDETIQGNWSQVEAQVYAAIDQALQAGIPIIYDATNAKRVWRMGLLQKLRQYADVDWMGWYLKTPLETCLQWNQQRDRQVPESVIEQMSHGLKQFPPDDGEGFTALHTLKPDTPDSWLQQVNERISQLPKTKINRNNRNRPLTFHSYSRLLDFERLMYLIRLLIQYPGLGNLQTTAPEVIQEVFGQQQEFPDEIEEICAFLAKIADPLYANPQAVAQDLQWLEQNGLLGGKDIKQPLALSVYQDQNDPTHQYSDIEPFSRLINTIRLILHDPFIRESGSTTLKSFVARLHTEGLIKHQAEDKQISNLRKDIEKVLKPYEILPHFSMRRGYFTGTAILSFPDLVKVFRLLESQAKSLEDPESLEVYELFQERMQWSQLADTQSYPVRAIHNRNIVNLEKLSPSALARNMKKLEAAIAQGQLLELGRIAGSVRYQSGKDNYFFAYPLQLVFHNIGWYLGLERYDGENQGLLQFERVDRLFLGHTPYQKRPLAEQWSALKRLRKLYECSGGIYLGKDVKQQQCYLSRDTSQRKLAEVRVELWFNDAMFRFISEGTKRFPLKQMKMSKSFNADLNRSNKTLFILKKSNDPHFPHRYQVKLPCWCVDDYDFHRWILGFGGQVKVITPDSLKTIIQQKGTAIAQLYNQESNH